MATKKELERAKNQALKELRAAQEHLNEIDELIHEQINAPKYAALVGKCFQYKNFYSSGDPVWMEYCRVLAYDGQECFALETVYARPEELAIKIDKQMHYAFDPMMNREEISLEKYLEQRRIVEDKINSDPGSILK